MKEGFPIFSETLSFTYVSAGTRTQDLRIKSPLLYQLSYAHSPRVRQAMPALIDT